MKLKNIKEGDLVYVKTEEDVLRMKGAQVKGGCPTLPGGEVYVWHAEGARSGQVCRVSEVNEETGQIGLCNLDYYVSHKFLRRATPEDIEATQSRLKELALDEARLLVRDIDVILEVQQLSELTGDETALISKRLLQQIAKEYP